jgi:hypothetical protein
MCFSTLASVTAGTALTAAGAVTVVIVPRRNQLPLALVPLLFGLQQLTEGAVWWSLDHAAARVMVVSTTVYLLFAFVLWPFLVPFAILCLESVPSRRKVLAAFLALGSGVGLVGLYTVYRGPGTPHVDGSSIQYGLPSFIVIGLYLLATCGSALLSSHRALKVIGAAALVLALVTLWLYTAVFVSLWCFFSAVLTIMIFVRFWSLRRSRQPAAF